MPQNIVYPSDLQTLRRSGGSEIVYPSDQQSASGITYPSDVAESGGSVTYPSDLDDRSFIERALPTALRVIPSVAGTVIGAAGGPLGAVAGGVVGGSLGELLAETYEDRPEINWGQVALQGGLNAIPIWGRAATLGRQIALHGAQGAVLGGAGTAATELMEGRTPTVSQIASGAGVGGVLGAGGGAVARRLAGAPPRGTRAGLTLEEWQALSPEEALAKLREQQNLRPLPDTPEGPSLRERYLDRFAPLRELEQQAGLDPTTTDASVLPSKQVDLALGGARGQTEDRLRDFLEIRTAAEREGIWDDLQDLVNLNAMESASERLRRRAVLSTEDADFARSDRLTPDTNLAEAREAGPSVDLLESLGMGERLPAGFSPDRLRAARQALTEKYAARPEQAGRLQALAKQFHELNLRELQENVDAGFIDRDTGTFLIEENLAEIQQGRGYAPLTREMDEAADPILTAYRNAGVTVPTQHLFYRLNGSSKLSKDPFIASVQRMEIGVNERARNTALRSLVRLRESNDVLKEVVRPLKAHQHPAAGEGKIVVFEDGKPLAYAVPEPVARALNSTPASATGLVERVMRQVGGIFRAGTTTANLAFALPNVARDLSDLQVLSGDKGRALAGLFDPRLFREWAKGVKSVITQDEAYRAYQQSGADFSTFQANVREWDRAVTDSLTQRRTPLALAGKLLTSPIKAAEYINTVLEKGTKVAAHQRFRAAGLSPEEAAWRTRMFGGSPDYARRGTSMQLANTLVPFLNAQIQGLDRLALVAKEHPKQAALVLAAMTAHLGALQALNLSFTDPDGTRSWDRITPREKQGNWILFLPGTFVDPTTGIERRNYLKIPAGHSINLFRAPLQAALDGEDPESVLNAVLSGVPGSPSLDADRPIASAFGSAVSAVNPIVRVPVELAANRDFFRDTPIISRRLSGAEDRDQYTERTAGLARVLGQATNTSPLRIEHATRGVLGGLGEAALSAGDALVPRDQQARAATSIPGLQEVSEIPVVSGITRPIIRRFVGGPASVDQQAHEIRETFYDNLAAAQKLQETIRLRVNRGDVAGARRALSSPRAKRLYALANTMNQLSTAAGRIRRAGGNESRILAAMARVAAMIDEAGK